MPSELMRRRWALHPRAGRRRRNARSTSSSRAVRMLRASDVNNGAHISGRSLPCTYHGAIRAPPRRLRYPRALELPSGRNRTLRLNNCLFQRPARDGTPRYSRLASHANAHFFHMLRIPLTRYRPGALIIDPHPPRATRYPRQRYACNRTGLVAASGDIAEHQPDSTHLERPCRARSISPSRPPRSSAARDSALGRNTRETIVSTEGAASILCGAPMRHIRELCRLRQVLL